MLPVNSHQLRFCYCCYFCFKRIFDVKSAKGIGRKKKKFRKMESYFNKKKKAHTERQTYLHTLDAERIYRIYFFDGDVSMRMCTTSELFSCEFRCVCSTQSNIEWKMYGCLQTGEKVFSCLVGTFICCNFPSP